MLNKKIEQLVLLMKMNMMIMKKMVRKMMSMLSVMMGMKVKSNKMMMGRMSNRKNLMMIICLQIEEDLRANIKTFMIRRRIEWIRKSMVLIEKDIMMKDRNRVIFELWVMMNLKNSWLIRLDYSRELLKNLNQPKEKLIRRQFQLLRGILQSQSIPQLLRSLMPLNLMILTVWNYFIRHKLKD